MGKAKLNWLFALSIVVLGEVPDLLITTKELNALPFWVLYYLAAAIDMAAATILFKCIKEFNVTPKYIQVLGWFTVVAIGSHFIFWVNEWVYREFPWNILHEFNKLFYKNFLDFILALKGIALLWSGYGILRLRKRKRASDWADIDRAPSIVYSSDYDGYRCVPGKQSTGD